MNLEHFLISAQASVRDAMIALSNLHNTTMTLFVVDEDRKMLGTLTDGDIRRSLIDGMELDTPVSTAMFTEFRYLSSPIDVEKIREFREREILLIPILDTEGRIRDLVDLSRSRSKLPVDAVLMAGGKGERLRPRTLTVPKPLLPLGGKAIIDYNIERLADFGLRNIHITVNYLKEQLIEHFRHPLTNGVRVNCVEEEEFFGTIGALRLVKEFDNDTILVMNSDLLTDIDFEDMYLHFRQHDAMMSAAAVPYSISVPYGIFELEGREIVDVKEKPTYSFYANAGIYMIKREALAHIPGSGVFNATDLITALAAAGQRVIRYPLTKLWIDIGTPDEFRKAEEVVNHLNSQ